MNPGGSVIESDIGLKSRKSMSTVWSPWANIGCNGRPTWIHMLLSSGEGSSIGKIPEIKE